MKTWQRRISNLIVLPPRETFSILPSRVFTCACILHIIFLPFYACTQILHILICFVTRLPSGKALFLAPPSLLMVVLQYHSLHLQNLNTEKQKQTWPKLKQGNLNIHKFTIEISTCMIVGGYSMLLGCFSMRHMHCFTFIIFKSSEFQNTSVPLGFQIKNYGLKIHCFDCVWFILSIC